MIVKDYEIGRRNFDRRNRRIDGVELHQIAARINRLIGELLHHPKVEWIVIDDEDLEDLVLCTQGERLLLRNSSGHGFRSLWIGIGLDQG